MCFRLAWYSHHRLFVDGCAWGIWGRIRLSLPTVVDDFFLVLAYHACGCLAIEQPWGFGGVGACSFALLPPAYHEVGQRRFWGVEGLLDVETAVTPRFALMGCPPALDSCSSGASYNKKSEVREMVKKKIFQATYRQV